MSAQYFTTFSHKYLLRILQHSLTNFYHAFVPKAESEVSRLDYWLYLLLYLLVPFPPKSHEYDEHIDFEKKRIVTYSQINKTLKMSIVKSFLYWIPLHCAEVRTMKKYVESWIDTVEMWHMLRNLSHFMKTKCNQTQRAYREAGIDKRADRITKQTAEWRYKWKKISSDGGTADCQVYMDKRPSVSIHCRCATLWRRHLVA